MALLHDLRPDRKRQLREEGFHWLSLEHDGYEYCETDQEIATQLAVSPYTVHKDLGNIFLKMCVNSAPKPVYQPPRKGC